MTVFDVSHIQTPSTLNGYTGFTRGAEKKQRKACRRQAIYISSEESERERDELDEENEKTVTELLTKDHCSGVVS